MLRKQDGGFQDLEGPGMGNGELLFNGAEFQFGTKKKVLEGGKKK